MAITYCAANAKLSSSMTETEETVNGGKNALAPNQRLNAPIANEKHMSMATTHPQNMSIKWVKNDMIKAMKQALEALEEIVKWYGVRDKNDVMMPPLNQNPEIKESMDAITVLRQAIEQAEKQEQGEPVAWMNNKDFEPIRVRIMQEAYELADSNDFEGYNAIKVMCGDVQRMLPPKRTWVSLTDEEIDKTHETQVWDARRSYARAIEAKLKEKNATQ